MSQRAELSTGEALVGLLEAYGVTHIFGIPGVHNVEMYRALPRSKITHILPRHEQGAGFMADGYARASGKPGMCFTITGPGLLNILTPMGQAYSDSSPMFVISSALDIKDAAQGRGRLHELQSQFAAARSITNQASIAYTPRDVRDGIAQSFAALASTRPRPAYLEIPLDLLKEACGDGWTPRSLPPRPQPNAQQVKQAAELLTKAQRPILLLGGGAAEAGYAAQKIAEQLGAFVFTTTAGKGIVAEDHPLCLGYRWTNPAIKELLDESDCILAVGSEISETDAWESPYVLERPIIRIDIDPASLVRPHPSEIAILSDAKPALEAIAAALPSHDSASRRVANEALVAGYRANEASNDRDLRKLLRQVLAVIRRALPRDAIVASDMTQIAYAANEIFPVFEPRSWIHPVGFGTLGFATPAGIGAKVACPEKPVAVLIGDYGFQYTLNELGTAAELRQPLVILLWNNDALGQIRDDMIHKGIQPNAVSLINPDFQTLAKAYNCHAAKPTSLGGLEQAIVKALRADRPTLIEMTPSMVSG
jgi:5-guanidino-2-oxopentanoate decarboxylase